MKVFILLLLISGITGITAQTETDPLDLGQYLIEGESGIFSDSLRSAENLERFWKIEDAGKLRFFKKIRARASILPDFYERADNILIRAVIGDKDFIRSRLVIKDDLLKIFNFSVSALNHEYNEFQRNREGDFHWQPEIGSINISAGGNYRDINSDILDTTITGADLEIRSSKLEISENLGFNFRLWSAYNIYEQMEEESEDLDGTADLNLYSDKLAFITSIGRKKEIWTGDIDLIYYDLGFLREIGIWFGLNENDPMLMAQFKALIPVNEEVSLFAANKAHTVSRTWSENLADNEYMTVDHKAAFQTLKPIDLTVGIKIESISSSVYYNLETYLDYPVYYSDLTQNNPDPVPEEFIRHQLCVDTEVDISTLILKNHISYRLNKIYPALADLDFSGSKEACIFEPKLLALLTAVLKLKPVELTVCCEYESGSEGFDGRTFEDMISLKGEIGLKSTEFLTFLVGAENILNRDNIDYPGEKAEDLVFWGGLEIRF